MDKMNHGTVKNQLKYCVGIGASAGGVEALQELFRNMPLDTGASFIVVQHLSPDSVSMMDKILQKSVKMPVRLAEENIIKDMIRKMIVFAKHNVFRDAPFSKLDLIVCRNMFIYVKSEVQQRTLGNFHHLLNDDGCLFLGNSESLGDLEGAFDVLDRKWKIFRKNKYFHTENNGFYLWDSLSHPQKAIQESAGSLRSRVRPNNIFEKLFLNLQDPRSWWTVLVKLFRLLKAEAGTFACRTDSLIIPSVRVLRPA